MLLPAFRIHHSTCDFITHAEKPRGWHYLRGQQQIWIIILGVWREAEGVQERGREKRRREAVDEGEYK